MSKGPEWTFLQMVSEPVRRRSPSNRQGSRIKATVRRCYTHMGGRYHDNKQRETWRTASAGTRCVACGSVTGAATMENSTAAPQKHLETELLCDPAIPLLSM